MSEKTKKTKAPRSAIALRVAGALYVALALAVGVLYWVYEDGRDELTAIGLGATIAGLGFVALDLAERRVKEARERDKLRESSSARG